jgi:hypothetical protein
MTDRPTDINLRLALERNALETSRAGVNSLTKEMLGFKAAAADAGAEGDKAASRLSRVMSGVRSTIDADTNAMNSLRASILETSKTAETLQKKTGGGLQGLRRTGSALNQLGLGELGRPVQIAGDIGQVAKEADEVIKSLGPLAPALSVVGGAVVGWEVGLKVLDLELDGIKKTTAGAVTGLEAYYKALETGTTESIQNQLKALQNKNRLELAELQQLQDARNNAFISEQHTFGGDLAARVKFGLGEAAGAFKPVDERIKQLTDSTAGASGQISALEQALKSSGVATNDAVEAEHKLAQARLSGLDEELQRELKIEQLKRSGASSKTIQELLDASQQEAASIRDRIPALEAEAKASKEGESALEKYNDRLKQLTADAKAFQELLDQQKGKEIAAGWIKDIITLPSKLIKGVETSPLKKALDKQVQDVVDRDNRLADVQQKYNNATKEAEQKSLEQRAEIQKRYNDRLVEIARQAADAAQQATERLVQQQQDLATGLGRDLDKINRDAQYKELDIRIGAAREDEKATRDHFQRLEQIRKEAADREFGLILNRDFLGLFNSRRQTTRDINGANSDFNSQTNERRTAQRQQFDDLRRSIERERSERLIAYNQQMDDAQKAYRREMVQAEQARRNELQRASEQRQHDLADLSQKLRNERTLRYNAYVEELKLANTFGKARVDAERKIQEALLAQTNAMLRRVSGSSQPVDIRTLAHRAAGGPLAAGQASWVNEPESFNGARFPPGLGVFIPAQGGTVSKGRSGNISVQFNITGNNPEAIARVVRTEITRTMKEYIA